KARDIAVPLPAFDLPSIDDLRPFPGEEGQGELLAIVLSRRLGEQSVNEGWRGDVRLPEKTGIEIIGDARDGLHGDPRQYGRFVSGKMLQLDLRRICERLGECRQQYLRLRIGARQMHRAVQGAHRIARDGRTRKPRRPTMTTL